MQPLYAKNTKKQRRATSSRHLAALFMLVLLAFTLTVSPPTSVAQEPTPTPGRSEPGPPRPEPGPGRNTPPPPTEPPPPTAEPTITPGPPATSEPGSPPIPATATVLPQTLPVCGGTTSVNFKPWLLAGLALVAAGVGTRILYRRDK